eukprot:11278409-Alexandrium_andersonii.AAC.1
MGPPPWACRKPSLLTLALGGLPALPRRTFWGPPGPAESPRCPRGRSPGAWPEDAGRSFDASQEKPL